MGLHKIKLITKDTNINTLPMTKLDWDLEVEGYPYQVVRIEGYNHAIRGFDQPMNLWAYPRNEEPTYENLVEVSTDYIVQWGIIYQPKNVIRNHHDEIEIRSVSGATITRNGLPFYTTSGDEEYAISLAKVLIRQLQDHPINFTSYNYMENLLGRKVWWKSEPGIITSFIHGQACVIIEPDGIEHFSIPAEYDNPDDRFMIDDYAVGVKVEIFSEHINWFRK